CSRHRSPAIPTSMAHRVTNNRGGARPRLNDDYPRTGSPLPGQGGEHWRTCPDCRETKKKLDVAWIRALRIKDPKERRLYRQSWSVMTSRRQAAMTGLPPRHLRLANPARYGPRT